MPNDQLYGADTEVRIALMADAATDPDADAWNYLEFKTLNLNPELPRFDRPLLGRARDNALDPTKPRDGMPKVNLELVLDLDANMVPLALQHFLGAATTSGPATGIYTHTWKSGGKTCRYAALQIKTGPSEWRIIRGVTLAGLSLEGRGDTANNYDLALSLQALSRSRGSSALGNSPGSALPAASPASRVIFKVDGTAASNVLQASANWDRNLIADGFLSSTVGYSGFHPEYPQKMSGGAQVRALAAAFDDLEEDSTEFGAILQATGLDSGYDMTFEMPKAQFDPAGLPINGPGLVERTFNFNGHQDASNAAFKITVKNEVSAYA